MALLSKVSPFRVGFKVSVQTDTLNPVRWLGNTLREVIRTRRCAKALAPIPDDRFGVSLPHGWFFRQLTLQGQYAFAGYLLRPAGGSIEPLIHLNTSPSRQCSTINGMMCELHTPLMWVGGLGGVTAGDYRPTFLQESEPRTSQFYVAPREHLLLWGSPVLSRNQHLRGVILEPVGLTSRRFWATDQSSAGEILLSDTWRPVYRVNNPRLGAADLLDDGEDAAFGPTAFDPEKGTFDY